MLQKQTVNTETLGILKELAALPILQDFALAGGTSLALRLGHRISIDLDFFTRREFDPLLLRQELKSFQPRVINESRNTLSVVIKNVKVEFIRHDYPLIRDLKEIEGAHFYSLEDVAAMKLNAVINRGSKKDFFDLFELIKLFDLSEIISFYKEKYEVSSTLMLLKSLVYFDDAEEEPDPISLDHTDWEEVKTTLIRVTSNNFDK